MAATIYDVAKQAGVSTATVSKVLSNTPYVRDATRAKVLAAVETLHYTPNLAARGLSKARTFIIGVVIPYTSDYLFSDPHLWELIRGIEAETRRRGYSILLSTGAEAEAATAPSPFVNLIRSNYMDGAVLIAASVLASPDGQLAATTLPCVAVGYHALGGSGNIVHTDDRQGAYQATRHLLALGHRRIAVITAVPQITALKRRLNGYKEALKDDDLAFAPELIAQGDFSSESGYQAAEELLALQPRPSAIFAFNDRMAMGAIRRIREAGLAVPNDIAVVGFDDIPAAALFDPPLTTVRQPAQEMGASAVRMLLDLIEGDSTGFPDRTLPAELIVRESCGAGRDSFGRR